MNNLPEEDENTDRLQRLLEEVTAEGTHPASRDAEAGLREAWLAFGRLLEAADQAQGENWSLEAITPKDPRKPASHRQRYLRTIAALAAALCVAVGVNWWLAHVGPQGNPQAPMAHTEGQGAHPQPNEPAPPAPNRVIAVQKNMTTPPKAGSAANATTWDDSLDTQITSVSQQIESVQLAWQHRVDDLDLVQYRIDEFSTGLTNDAL